MLLNTIAALALLLQATPTPPTPPTPRPSPRPRVKVHAPNSPRWDDRRESDSHLVRDTSFAVREGQRLEVSNFGGTITVSAWNENRIRISAPEGSDAFSVDVGSITIEVDTRGERGHGPGEADLTIQVPAWMELELSGNEVDITTRGTRGAVQANTVQGTIRIDGGEGNIEATSVEGDLTVSNVAGRVQLNTVEGQVTLRNVSGSALEVETVDGDIAMTAVTSANISANTVDGNVSWGGTLSPTGTYRFATHDGDILLSVNGEPDATVSVETFDGTFDSDWPILITGAGGRRDRITFKLGQGRARLELSSFDGTISLKRGASR